MKLTDEQILALWSGSAEAVRPVLGSKKVLDFARAIEAALSAKQGEAERDCATCKHVNSAPSQNPCNSCMDSAEYHGFVDDSPFCKCGSTHPATVNTALLERIKELEQAVDVALEALEKHGTSLLNHEDEYAEAIAKLKEVRGK